MRIIRFQPNNWRPDERTLVNTGDYRIPIDLSDELADRALLEGAAVLVSAPPLQTKPAPPVETKPARRVAIK